MSKQMHLCALTGVENIHNWTGMSNNTKTWDELWANGGVEVPFICMDEIDLESGEGIENHYLALANWWIRTRSRIFNEGYPLLLSQVLFYHPKSHGGLVGVMGSQVAGQLPFAMLAECTPRLYAQDGYQVLSRQGRAKMPLGEMLHDHAYTTWPAVAWYCFHVILGLSIKFTDLKPILAWYWQDF